MRATLAMRPCLVRLRNTSCKVPTVAVSRVVFIDSGDVRKGETISGCNTIWSMLLFFSKAIASQ